MLKNCLIWALGLLFGWGLIMAQMTNPAQVLAFLDISGDWNPSLGLVMASALGCLALLQRWLKLPTDQAQAGASCASNQNGIDRSLILGSALFGIGWGISGICPGPAIVNLSSGNPEAYLFVLAMFGGFALFRLLHHKR